LLSAGQVVGKYVVEALVGEGGLARVYRVRHQTLGSAHALKVLGVKGGAVHRRLVREGRIQATLDHPHVVAVTDVIEHDGHAGLVMEYIEGLALDRLLASRGALPVDAALGLMAQVLGAMRAAHAKGVLHRDLKPANVMLQPTSGGARAVVTDFGIARLMVDNRSGDTVQGDFLGTPGYMAPEQVSDPTRIDARADVYSLGALAYCLVCGRPPFLPGPSLVDTLQAAASADFPAVLDLRPDCPPAVAQTIEAALAPEPAERPANVDALGARLFGHDAALMEVLEGRPGVVDLRFDVGTADVAASPRSQGAIGGTAVPEDFDANTPALRPGGTAVPTDFGPSTEDVPDVSTPVPATASRVPPPAQPPTQDRPGMGRDLWAGIAAVVALVLAVVALRPDPDPIDNSVPEAVVSKAPPAPEPVPDPTPTAPPAPQAAPPSAEPPAGAPAEPQAERAPPPPVEAEPTVDRASSDELEPAPSAPPTDADPTDAPPEPPGETVPPEAPPTDDPTDDPAHGPTDATADADTTADADASEVPEPSVTPAEPEAPPPPPEWTGPQLTGAWTGRYGGRPLTLRVVRQTDGRVQAEIDVLAGGQSWRTFELSGSVSAGGALSLNEAGPGWQVTGQATARSITGTLSHPDLRKPMALKAERR